jgi:hypothetical protein
LRRFCAGGGGSPSRRRRPTLRARGGTTNAQEQPFVASSHGRRRRVAQVPPPWRAAPPPPRPFFRGGHIETTQGRRPHIETKSAKKRDKREHANSERYERGGDARDGCATCPGAVSQRQEPLAPPLPLSLSLPPQPLVTRAYTYTGTLTQQPHAHSPRTTTPLEVVIPPLSGDSSCLFLSRAFFPLARVPRALAIARGRQETAPLTRPAKSGRAARARAQERDKRHTQKTTPLSARSFSRPPAAHERRRHGGRAALPGGGAAAADRGDGWCVWAFVANQRARERPFALLLDTLVL